MTYLQNYVQFSCVFDNKPYKKWKKKLNITKWTNQLTFQIKNEQYTSPHSLDSKKLIIQLSMPFLKAVNSLPKNTLYNGWWDAWNQAKAFYKDLKKVWLLKELREVK